MEEVIAIGARWQEAAKFLATGGREVFFAGLTPAAGAYVLSRLFHALARPVLLITPESAGQETFLKDLAFFLGPQARGGPQGWPRLLGFPAHEVLPFRTLGFDA